MQDEQGQANPGFMLADCHEAWGDELERPIAWQKGSDASELAGKPIRLRFVLRDADLHSFRFAP